MFTNHLLPWEIIMAIWTTLVPSVKTHSAGAQCWAWNPTRSHTHTLPANVNERHCCWCRKPWLKEGPLPFTQFKRLHTLYGWFNSEWISERSDAKSWNASLAATLNDVCSLLWCTPHGSTHCQIEIMPINFIPKPCWDLNWWFVSLDKQPRGIFGAAKKKKMQTEFAFFRSNYMEKPHDEVWCCVFL